MTHLHRSLVAFIILLGLTRPLAAQETSTASAKTPAAHAEASAIDTGGDFERARRTLGQSIGTILAHTDATQGVVGIHAVDIDSGEVLYSHGADQPMNPASNMKLITSAAALDTFGPDHTFETQLLASRVDDHAVKGDLYLKGSGDAFLLFEDLLAWAGQLRQQGIEEITGDVVVDDTAFAKHYLPPGYGQQDEDASYRAPIGAVSVNFNAVTAVVEPADSPGQPPRCRLIPPNDHVEVVNKATTYSGRRRHIDVASESTKSGTRLVITGNIGDRASSFRSRRKRIDNPPAFAGSVFASALQMVGIDFNGEVTVGQTPGGADVLVSHQSQPLSYVMLAMNKWSNNFMAEQLLRALGRSEHAASTWAASLKKVGAFLDEAGIDTSKLTLHNGSGLYDGNLVSPKQFVHLLDYMSDDKWSHEYITSLAIAGIDGTLARRMTDEPTRGNVRAKTGTLNDVSALSGYLHTQSGRRVAFSVLVNDPPRRAWRYRPVQDRIVEAIAAFDQ